MGQAGLHRFRCRHPADPVAVEETAAVPTGNQALQRCERLYGAARANVAFWYLLSEFGVHLDGGVRRDSIWPTVAALKLTQDKEVISVVLHYSDVDNPESYSAGTGVRALFASLAHMLVNHAGGRPPYEYLEDELTDQYSTMLMFLRSQWAAILNFLPGEEVLTDPELPRQYARAATRHPDARDVIWSSTFLRWPTVAELPENVRDAQAARLLMKDDALRRLMETDVQRGKAYGFGSATGSRPQAETSLASWIAEQRAAVAANPLEPPVEWNHEVEDFPLSGGGNRHVTTAPRIVYLYDEWRSVAAALESAFPRLRDRLPGFTVDQPVLVYVSNSIKPGRVLGDPFVGQLAAYAVSFGALDPTPRLVVAVPSPSSPSISRPRAERVGEGARRY